MKLFKKRGPYNKLTKPQKRARHGRRFLRVFLSVSLVIIVLHITLPSIILYFLNRKLANMPEYTGHINTMQMNLFTCSYSWGGITLKKKGGEIPVPFVDVQKLKVSVDWKSLLKWRLVALVNVDNLKINFVKGPTKATTQAKVDKSWVDLANDAIPIDINRVKINDGEVHYRDYYTNPKVDLLVNKIYVIGENLSSVKDTTKVLPATVKLTAYAYDGPIVINAKVDFLSTLPTFDLSAELKNLPLTYLNNFFQAYAKMDVQKGMFSVYAELAAKDGRIKGYAKPFIKDLDVIDNREAKGMPFKDIMKESLVEVGAWILKDKKRDQIATKINLEGSITKPDYSIWGILGEALINAFLGSLFPTIENTVNINNINIEEKKNILEKIFDPDKKKKKATKIKKQKKQNTR